MADIRINALTEASASVTTDFLPIDGSTGTRKLSAYSPSFGGNATVGGTLSTAGNPTFGTSGNTTLTLGPTGALYTHYIRSATAGGAIQIQGDPATGNRWVSLGHVDNASSYTEGLKIDSNAIVRATGTTASTSTSSGALVVGNGTSGGLGVGGAVNIGGTLTANGTTFNLSTASANGSFINMDGLAGNFKIITTRTGGVDRWYFGQDTAAESGSNAGSPFFIRALTDAGAVIDTPLTITRAAGGRLTTPRPVTISDSTASTSTSSGALVVNGGVGIAGALYSQQNTNGILAGAYFENASTGNAATIRHRLTAGASTCDIEAYGSGHATLANRLRFGTSNGQIDFVPAGVNTVGINNNTVSILASTASTGTSSGALVVSGGVGVAGAINAGDQIKSERTSGTDTASAVLGVLTTSGAGVTNSFGIDARVVVNNSSGTTTSATGLRALSRVGNASTVTQAVAMLAQVDNPGGGTITTAYGLYVNPITAGGTNYAIYTGGGRINFQSLPTSSAGLAAGTIWNDSGTLKVA